MNNTENNHLNRKSYLKSMLRLLNWLQRANFNNFSYPLKIQLVGIDLPKEAQPNKELKEIYKNFIGAFNDSLDKDSENGIEQIYEMLKSKEEDFREAIKERSISDKVPSEVDIEGTVSVLL
jgi:hypothetical protein